MAIMQRVETVFTGLGGTPWYNRLYFSEEGGSPDDRINDVTNFWEAFQSSITDTISWVVQGDVAFVDDATGLVVDIMTGTPGGHTGTNTGTMHPPATQGLIRLRTGVFLSGRQITGRIFVPGLCVSTGTAGRPSAAFIALADAAAENLDADAAGWRVYSPTRATSVEIVSWSTWSEYAVLRSRRD